MHLRFSTHPRPQHLSTFSPSITSYALLPLPGPISPHLEKNKNKKGKERMKRNQNWTKSFGENQNGAGNAISLLLAGYHFAGKIWGISTLSLRPSFLSSLGTVLRRKQEKYFHPTDAFPIYCQPGVKGIVLWAGTILPGGEKILRPLHHY